MQRYFFHTQTDTRFTDVDGVELDGPVQARSQAIQLWANDGGLSRGLLGVPPVDGDDH